MNVKMSFINQGQELSFLFCFLPNFSTARVITKAVKGSKVSIGFVDFADEASAYVAIVVMQVHSFSGDYQLTFSQGFFFGDRSLHCEYDYGR